MKQTVNGKPRDTEPALSQQRGLTPWQPGQSGNPAGRPKGSRNKLSEEFLDDLVERWEKSGAIALEIMAKNDPSAFCKLVANILPTKFDATISLTEELHLFHEVRDFAQAYRLARSVIGADPIELPAIPVNHDKD